MNHHPIHENPAPWRVIVNALHPLLPSSSVSSSFAAAAPFASSPFRFFLSNAAVSLAARVRGVIPLNNGHGLWQCHPRRALHRGVSARDHRDHRDHQHHEEDKPRLTHTDASGKATMVDVSAKADSKRTAVAQGFVALGAEAFGLVEQNKMKKGDVLTVAELAGICGAKWTSTLIPLCHNIQLSAVHVHLSLVHDTHSVRVEATAVTTGKTGVEMEALTAVSVACLCVYDMCKAVTKDAVIRDIRLLSKTGGKSGDYLAAAAVYDKESQRGAKLFC